MDDAVEKPAAKPATPAADLEIKDAHLIFSAVWSDLKQVMAELGLPLPKAGAQN